MTKLGEGHPPPGASMVKSRWRSSYVAVATLLRSKMESIVTRHRSRRMKLGCNRMMGSGEQVTWSPVKRNEGENLLWNPSGSRRKIWVVERKCCGSKRDPFVLERCSASWGARPPSGDAIHWWRMDWWLRVNHWPTKWWDNLTANPSSLGKPQH